MARKERLPIWPQFKYNQFIREQFDKDSGMTFEKAVRNWNKLKKNNQRSPNLGFIHTPGYTKHNRLTVLPISEVIDDAEPLP